MFDLHKAFETDGLQNSLHCRFAMWHCVLGFICLTDCKATPLWWIDPCQAFAKFQWYGLIIVHGFSSFGCISVNNIVIHDIL